MNVRVCCGVLVAFVLVLGISTLNSQEPGGNEADAHNPSGPPGPMESPSIWKVDPLTGALTIKVPITSALPGGRGPHYGQTIMYNSASTLTFQFQSVQSGYAVYDWTGAANSLSSFAPHGPWTWNGPIVRNNSVSIPQEPELNPQGQIIGTFGGCTGYGPYLYEDRDGGVHDLNVLGYYGDGSGYTPNPGCDRYEVQNYTSDTANYTVDGAALLTKMSAYSATVYEPDGTFLGGNGLEDSNGNFNNGNDAEGRPQLAYVSGNCNFEAAPSGPTGTCRYSLDDATGTSRYYKISTQSIAISSSLSMPHPLTSEVVPASGYIGPSNSYANGVQINYLPPQSVIGVTSVGYPDGTSYTFDYDPTYATVNEIDFPTGGSVQFTWGIRNIGEVTAAVSAESTLVVKQVVLNDGAGNTSTWTYTYPDYASGQQYPLQSTEVDPDGTKINHFSNAAFLFSTLFKSGAPTSQESHADIYPSGSGSKIRSTDTVFYSAGLGMGKPHQVVTTYWDVSGGVQQCDQYAYDQWGNVIEKDESDIYPYSSTLCNVPSGTWLRKTFTSYPTSFCTTSLTANMFDNVYSACASGTPANFDAAHIVNKPSQIVVTDGNNHPYSVVQYGYDETSVQSASGCGSGCYNHDSAYGTSRQTGRGNLTSESRCSQTNISSALTVGSNGLISASTASAACTLGFLVTHHTYDLTGQRVSTTDPVGNATTFSYADSFSAGAPPGPTNSFLTRVVHPKNSLSDTYQYTWYTGQETSHSDWNLQTTTYSYADPGGFSRLVEITGPSTAVDGTTGNSASEVTELAYVDEPYTGSSGTGFQITTQHQVDAASTPTMTSTTVTFDGLARKVNTNSAFPQCSTGLQVNTAYDVMGRVFSATNPFCSTSDPTYGVTQHLYDALGRETQTTLPDGSVSKKSYAGTATEITDPFNGTRDVQHVDQADGIGHLISVCEMVTGSLGSGSPAACGQQIAATGYLTTYAYDPLDNLDSVIQYGLVRSFSYDSLSRLTTSLNPEVGTETYAYNNTNASPCGLNVSAPCTRTDAREVITSYTYDAMGRLTGKSYSAGYGNTTGPISDLSSCYQYDTQLSSVTDSYTNGQLTLEWQQSGACPTSAVTSIPSGAVAVRIKSLHDGAGRAGQEQECMVGSGCSQTTGAGIFRYTYNLLGNPVQSNNGIFKATVVANQVAQSTGNGTTMTAPSATWKTVYDSADHVTVSTVQDQPAWSGTIVWPSTTFSAGPVLINPINYDPFGHMTSVFLDAAQNLGSPMIDMSRQYDNRGRISYEVDTGAGASSSGTHSLGTIVIGGSEQHVNQTYDQGTISATINGHLATVSYGQGSTAQTIASQLSQAIQTADSSFLNAQTDGDVSVLVSTSSGSSTDYSVTTSVTYDSTDFTHASFTAMAASMVDGDASDSSNGLVYYYYVPQGGYAPNGNILVQSDSVMGDWFYTYNAVDRLVTATPDTTAPSAYLGNYGCWAYDAYGNRTSEAFSTTPCSGNPPKASWATYNSGTNNQMVTSSYAPSGVIYDSSGNTLKDGRNQYWYDAEGQLCAVKNLTSGSITQYLYDAEGARFAEGSLSTAPGPAVSGSPSNSPTCAPPQAAGSTLSNADGLSLAKRFLVDTGGEQVTELSEGGSETWTHSNVFIGGKLTATYNISGIFFPLTDPLGTKRVSVNNSGTIAETCYGLPFGNDINNPLTANCTGLDATEHHFTGKERDQESGNDYFGARYYASTMGRFLSPDWSAKEDPVPYARLDNPQTLNLYAYLRNNPLAGIDADGHCPPGGNCDKVQVTVTQPTPEMKVNEAGPAGPTSGPGVQTTIKITDHDKPITGMDVTEHPVVTDNLTGKSHDVKPVTATTDSAPGHEGEFKDNVIAPMENNSPTTAEHKADLISGSLGLPDYSHNISMTLAFTTPSGAACQATYTEVFQNVDPKTGTSVPVNSNGVNFTFTRTQPVVSPQP